MSVEHWGRPMLRDTIERELDLYYDGELGRIRRLRVERQLRRYPGLRRDLAARETVGALLRKGAEAEAVPDFWGQIAAQIPPREPMGRLRAPRRRGRGKGKGNRRRAPRRRTPMGALRRGARTWATAAALLPLLFVLPGDVPLEGRGIVRSLYAAGRQVIVVDEPDEATIIWLVEPDVELSEEVGDDVRV